MLKRMLLLMLALILLAAPAQAASNDVEAFYLLVNRDAAGVDTPIGSAVLFRDRTTLLTTVWATLASHELYAQGAGGSIAITKAARPAENSELVLLTLAQPSPAQPLEISELQGSVSVWGYSGDQLVESPLLYPAYMEHEEQLALLFSAPAPLLPGSVVVDSHGGLAGLTLASYGEGENRYMGLTVDGLQAALSSVPSALPEGVSWLTGFSVTPGAGKITVDWSNVLPTCEQEDCCIGLVFSDTQNPYYSYLITTDEEQTDLCLTPGRTFNVWVQHAHGEIVHDGFRPLEMAVSVTLPEAEAFDRFDYTDHEIYLGTVPALQAEAALTTKVPPLEAITAQTLTDPDTAVFMQVSSTYTIAETSESDLLVTLSTPEGYTFDYLGLFIFDTTLQQGDVWNVDVTELIHDYLSFNETGEMSTGTYSLRYYLDGALANEITWTLE